MRNLLVLLCLMSCSVVSQQLVDPTRPLNQADIAANAGDGEQAEQDTGGFPAVSLSAIIISPQARYAIINGKTVYEGQQWRNFYLTSVKQHAIVLEGQGQSREFSLRHNINLIKDNAHVF